MKNDPASVNIDVTQILHDYSNGAVQSLDEVVSVVYTELRTLARKQLRGSSVHQQVQTTMLVHEAYEKLAGGQIQQVNDRRHFFAIASRAMRQIVVDTYRAENAAKRGGGLMQVTLSPNDIVDGNNPARVIAVDQALEILNEHDQELAEIVDLQCFGGLSTPEIAELTSTSQRTVQRKLQRAQAWLMHFMSEA